MHPGCGEARLWFRCVINRQAPLYVSSGPLSAWWPVQKFLGRILLGTS